MEEKTGFESNRKEIVWPGQDDQDELVEELEINVMEKA